MNHSNADISTRIAQLQATWNAAEAGDVISDLTTAVWQAGGPDARTDAQAAALRELLAYRLGRGATLEDLNLLYRLEQGIGLREQALSAARQAADLADRTSGGAATMDRVAATFQLAKALLYLDSNAEAVRLTEAGLALGDKLDARQPGDAGLLRLLADQHSRLVMRMVTAAGHTEQTEPHFQAAIDRWRRAPDPAGQAAALGLLAEARVFQGCWQQAVDLLRRAMAIVGYPQRTDGLAYGLWAGAKAICRLGDWQQAVAWTQEAARISHALGNAEAVQEARLVEAVALGAGGRLEEALALASQVAADVKALNMGTLELWVNIETAWLRMRAGRPADLPALRATCDRLVSTGYNLLAAEGFYALAQATKRAGQESREPLEQAAAMFRRLGMTWHLEQAARDALL
ncbi:MAG: hypothetical protein BIFFINMI_00804 [Phycisphaerae bacterium]|nr:hypothetical protein [Phycisphaerae bacterium]